MKNKILKKRNIWFHIIVGYLSCGIWAIVYFYYKNKDNKDKQTELKKKQMEIENMKKDILKNTKISISFGSDRGTYNECKRKSLYSKSNTVNYVDDYIIFDLETTGLYPNGDKIIEIGALKYKNNQLIDKFELLIDPEIEISSKISRITGITNEMIIGCEKINTVLPKFINFIEDYTLIAYNSSFDLGFIEYNINNLKMNEIKNKTIDALFFAKICINNTENLKLETLKKHFKLNFGSHRALEDCHTTNHIYQYCKEQYLLKK